MEIERSGEKAGTAPRWAGKAAVLLRLPTLKGSLPRSVYPCQKPSCISHSFQSKSCTVYESVQTTAVDSIVKVCSAPVNARKGQQARIGLSWCAQFLMPTIAVNKYLMGEHTQLAGYQADGRRHHLDGTAGTKLGWKEPVRIRQEFMHSVLPGQRQLPPLSRSGEGREAA